MDSVKDYTKEFRSEIQKQRLWSSYEIKGCLIKYPSSDLWIIGFLQVYPVAKYVKERGFETYGYDVNPKAMDFAEQTAAIKKAGNFGEFDVYILCVSAHKPDNMFLPQIDGLFQITDKISR